MSELIENLLGTGCNHEHVETARRMREDGFVDTVEQCQACGRIAKELPFDVMIDDKMPMVDTAIQNRREADIYTLWACWKAQ